MPSDYAETCARLKEDIVEVGRRIYNLGFVAANDGNISVRTGDNEILTTPTGVSKGFMTPDMIIKVDMAGNQLEGELKPSSELRLHLEVYRQRPDVRAVLHAHPPVATAFTVAGIPLDRPVLPEIVVSLGRIPTAKYATPSTEELPASIRPFLEKHDAILLENHGALTVGGDLFNALFKMEQIEHFAKISLYARLLGGERELPPDAVEKLLMVRERLGLGGRHPGRPEK
ncbi:MAG: class II aldolase/adducin family protein [Firmicutes bacterium]|nr:class II aldolase/adducin family protein [Bacillota bacterium]